MNLHNIHKKLPYSEFGRIHKDTGNRPLKLGQIFKKGGGESRFLDLRGYISPVLFHLNNSIKLVIIAQIPCNYLRGNHGLQ